MNSQQARLEAERCLYCFDAPCTQQCPVRIDIPTFISMIRSGNVIGAAQVVRTANPLANICGKVCPQEVFCQAVCTRGKQDKPIDIRELHFFATQEEHRRGFSALRSFPEKAGKVAVLGAGPAGLACAFELVKRGHDVHVYDAVGLGGVPSRSIPTFRLGEVELMSDIEFLSPHIHPHHMRVDRSGFEQLCGMYDALFVGVGLGVDRRLGVQGEHLHGVLPVLAFLERAKRNAGRNGIGNRMVIVGGGNVSLDAAATARRLGAREVMLLYRRSEREMRVWKNELEEARRMGVQFQFLTTPIEILGSAGVQGVRCRRTRLADRLDKSGRPVPVEIEGSEFILDADAVIVAIGQEVGADFAGLMERTPQGYLRVDEHFRTSLPKVFAGGDVIAGEGTVVQSVAHGKQAARWIDEAVRRTT